jgi:hypothetical protein
VEGRAEAKVPSTSTGLREGREFDRYDLLENLRRPRRRGRSFFALDRTTGEPLVVLGAPHLEAATTLYQNTYRLARMSNIPGLPPLLGGGVSEGQAYLASSWVPGPSLGELLEYAPPPPGLALGLVWNLVRGLSHLHGQQLFHGDIHPGNIRVDARGRIFLAGYFPAPYGGPATTVRDDDVVHRYLPPEAYEGAPADPSADVFALGLVVYELFTQRPLLSPGTAEVTGNATADLEEHLQAKLPDQGPLAQGLAPVLRRMLHPDPDRRPRTGAEVLALLLDVVPEASPETSQEGLARLVARATPGLSKKVWKQAQEALARGRIPRATGALWRYAQLVSPQERRMVRRGYELLTELFWAGKVQSDAASHSFHPALFYILHRIATRWSLRTVSRLAAELCHQLSPEDNLLPAFLPEAPMDEATREREIQKHRANLRSKVRAPKSLLSLAVLTPDFKILPDEQPPRYSSRLLESHGLAEEAIYYRAQELPHVEDRSAVVEDLARLAAAAQRVYREQRDAGVPLSAPPPPPEELVREDEEEHDLERVSRVFSGLPSMPPARPESPEASSAPSQGPISDVDSAVSGVDSGVSDAEGDASEAESGAAEPDGGASDENSAVSGVVAPPSPTITMGEEPAQADADPAERSAAPEEAPDESGAEPSPIERLLAGDAPDENGADRSPIERLLAQDAPRLALEPGASRPPRRPLPEEGSSIPGAPLPSEPPRRPEDEPLNLEDAAALFSRGQLMLMDDDLEAAGEVFHTVMEAGALEREHFRISILAELRKLIWQCIVEPETRVAHDRIQRTWELVQNLRLRELHPVCDRVLLATVPEDVAGSLARSLLKRHPSSISMRQAAARHALELGDRRLWAKHLIAAAQILISMRQLFEASKLMMAARTTLSEEEVAPTRDKILLLADRLASAGVAFRPVEAEAAEISPLEAVETLSHFLERHPGFAPAQRLLLTRAEEGSMPQTASPILMEQGRRALLADNLETASVAFRQVLTVEFENDEAAPGPPVPPRALRPPGGRLPQRPQGTPRRRRRPAPPAPARRALAETGEGRQPALPGPGSLRAEPRQHGHGPVPVPRGHPDHHRHRAPGSFAAQGPRHREAPRPRGHPANDGLPPRLGGDADDAVAGASAGPAGPEVDGPPPRTVPQDAQPGGVGLAGQHVPVLIDHARLQAIGAGSQRQRRDLQGASGGTRRHQ